MDKCVIVVILFIVYVFIDVFVCQLAALPAGFPAGSGAVSMTDRRVEPNARLARGMRCDVA